MKKAKAKQAEKVKEAQIRALAQNNSRVQVHDTTLKQTQAPTNENNFTMQASNVLTSNFHGVNLAWSASSRDMIQKKQHTGTKLDQFQFITILGSGAFGKVFKVSKR